MSVTALLFGAPLVSIVYVRAMVVNNNVLPNYPGPRFETKTIVGIMMLLALLEVWFGCFLVSDEMIHSRFFAAFVFFSIMMHGYFSFELALNLVHPAPGTFEVDENHNE
jgi:hypothetical protein